MRSVFPLLERVWPLLRALVLHVLSWSGWLAIIPIFLIFAVTRHVFNWPPLGANGNVLVSAPNVSLLVLLIGQASSLVVFILAWVLVERRSLQEMFGKGSSVSWRGLAWGLAAGTSAISAVVILVLGSGNLSLTRQIGSGSGRQVFASVGFILASCLLGPLTEEIQSRGYLFQNAVRGWGKPVAIIITAIVFSARHLQNPHTNGVGILNISLISVAMTIGMLRLSSLWYAIGWHIAWNAVTVLVLGTANSGLYPESFGISQMSLLSSSTSGSVFLSGGDFGLEGSLFTTLVLALQTAFVWRLGRDVS